MGGCMNIDFNNIKCKLCGRELKNRRALGNHLARSHKPYNVQQYVLEFFYDNKVPKCACGCGNEVKWHKTLYKYNFELNPLVSLDADPLLLIGKRI